MFEYIKSILHVIKITFVELLFLKFKNHFLNRKSPGRVCLKQMGGQAGPPGLWK